MIPFLDLKAQVSELREELDEALARVLDSGWFILGSEVRAFEEEYASYCGVEHCVGVASGLDALVLSLRALGVGRGDEVLVPAHTFVATWLAVSQTGATPVGVDIEADAWNMDPALARAAITAKTKAIVPVHLYGQPCNIDAFASLGVEYGIPVLFDAAQAHGASWPGQRTVGSEGIAACWSFYPGKNLGAFGDGGAITTNDGALAKELRLLRNYGSSEKYLHTRLGYNSRLDDLQAAVLRVKLRHLDDWNGRRQKLAAAYRTAISEIIVSLRLDGLRLPSPVLGASSNHLFVIQSPHRDAIQAALAARDIKTLIHYPIPPHKQPAYAEFAGQSFPIAEKAAREVLSLPMSPHHDVSIAFTVTSILRSFFESLA